MPGDDDEGFVFDDDPLVLREPERPAFPVDAPVVAGPSALAPLAPAEPEAAAAPATPPRASFVSRLAAWLVDMVVLGVADLAIVWVTSTAVLTAERLVGHPFTDAVDLVGTLVGVASTALVAGYFVVLQSGPGQTLGKAAMRIRVARVDGRPIGLGRSAVRFLGYFVSALPFGLGFLGALASSRRALHDRLAGTAVLRT
jgi:uncharacterized RDD family membrane protein YckC